MRKNHAGFSLLELLVTLGIAGILFFVALPGYQQVVLRSARAAARAALLDVSARQEQHFVTHKRYALALASLGLPDPFYIDARGDPVDAVSASYQVRLDLLDGRYHSQTAVPANRQAGDRACMALSLTRLGVRSASARVLSDPAGCW